ncbi:MAG: M23 family metallopeptidase [Chloroflexi bacterium]|nr:M23 family metallopeptidase [Chloroflexota bacterium]
MSSNFELTAVWEDEWYDDYEDGWYEDDPLPAPPPLSPTAVIILIPLLLMILAGIFLPKLQTRTAVPDTAVPHTSATDASQSPQFQAGDPQAFAIIYDNYTITQGPHGQSYGHSAIDIAAGRGKPIKSPINGTVTEFYVDQYNNPTLVIENDVYTITMLHGDFSTSVGEQLQIGDMVGVEGNNGYTMDMAGNLCYGRVWCGNHTHLNVYNKQIGANVNPLELIGN